MDFFGKLKLREKFYKDLPCILKKIDAKKRDFFEKKSRATYF